METRGEWVYFLKNNQNKNKKIQSEKRGRKKTTFLELYAAVVTTCLKGFIECPVVETISEL